MLRRSSYPRLWPFLLALVVAVRLGGQVIPPGTYSAVVITGDSIASSTVYVNGGTTFSLPTLTLANSTGLYWQQVGTLAGKAITQGTNSYLYVSGANNALTLDAATTVTGDVSIYSDGSVGTAITNQGVITHTNGTGQIYAANFTNDGSITASAGTLYLNYPNASYNATNTGTGTVTVDGSGTTIYLRGNFDNNGTLTAQNAGNLIWDGTNSTANLGNVVLNGGRALLNGTINNTAAILTAPSGGAFELYGGSIQGGSIAAGALTYTTSGGFLGGASLTGDLNLGTAGSGVNFTGGATFTGANATFANNAYLYWQQVGTLAGKAITQGTNSYIYVTGANNTLTLDAATTVTGDVSIYSDGSAGTAITNQGAITHTTGTGQIYAANFTNNGSITATAGTLYLNYPSASYNATNTGTVTVDGSGTTIYLRGNFDNNGTLTAQNSGNLLWDGANTTANLGNVVLNGGRALFNGTINNTAATLMAPSGGTFELLGGTIQGGTIAAGALTFTSSSGYLDGATLTGDLNLPTSGSNVRLIGGAGFTGATVTLANNAGIYWQQVGTLSGKTITQGTGSYLYVSGANNTLTLDAATTVTGDVSIYSDGSANTAIINQGVLTHTGGTGQIYAANFTNTGAISATAGTLYLNYPSASYNAANTGTVTADGSGTTIYLRGNFDNDGTLTAQNSGNLLWDGTNTTANLGNVVLNGGQALLNGTIINTAATLTAPSGGAFELYGGTIQGGTIAAGALTFTTSNGYLDGVSLTGDLNLGTASSGVRFLNGAAFTGVNATLANNSYLYWQQVGTLAGKAITQGTNSYIYVNGVNSALTLDAATTVSGDISIYSDGSAGTAVTNQGVITHTGGTGQIYAVNFTNSGSITATAGTLYLNYPSASYSATNTGTVTADGSGTTIYLRGNVDNNGTLTAWNAGILRWDGTNTTANLGNVEIDGGRALLNGTINNTAATLTAPSGGAFELYGGTIQGGSIAAGALTFTSSGGYLDGATLTGDLNLSTASANVRLMGGAGFTGANAALAGNAYLYWQQVGTLTGKAVTQGANSNIYVNGVNNGLTLDAATTVTGDVSIYSDGSAGTTITNQGVITHTGGSGGIYAANFTNSGSITASAGTLYLNHPSAIYNATNTGTVTVDGSGTTIHLRGNFDNNGTLTAQNSGTLLWVGTNTTANLGNVVLNGGRALLNSTINNTAATLTAPSGGTFELFGGTIQGGSIAVGALTFMASGGYLDGASLTGDLNLSTESANVRFMGGAGFTGANAILGSNAGLYWQQVGTLGGKTITMGTSSYIYVSGTNNALTLDAATTVTGDVSFYTDGSVGTAVTNQGAITHTAGSGILHSRSFTNAGTISATGGTLSIGSTDTGYTAVNTIAGTIHVNGGTVSLYAPTAAQFMNLGTINVQSGTLNAGSYLTNGSTGLIRGAGTISGDLTLAGGTLAPGNSIGTLTLINSDFLATSASIIELELNGVTSDLVTFQNPTSAVNLGAGLLALDLILLAPPTEGTNYTIMNISSGGSGFAGYLAGLPNSGDALTANYAGTDYTLNIGYLPNAIVLSYAVPEPSTYALIGAGLLLLSLRRFLRRRS